MKKQKEINWARWRWLRQHLKQVKKSPPPEEPQTKMVNFLTIIFAALPLITAGIYLTGMAYHTGECLVNGLDVFEFPWPADVTLAWGYLQWLDAGKEYLAPAICTIIAIAILDLMLFFWVKLRLRWAWWCHCLCSIPFPRVRRFLRKRARVPAPRLFIFFIWLKIIYDRFAILVLPALLVLLPAIFSRDEGIKAAQEQVRKLETGQLTTEVYSAQSPLLGNTPHIRLMCNTTHCAYRLKGGEVRLLRHDQIEQVQWMAPNEEQRH